MPKDYFMRLVEQLARTLASIVEHRQAGRPDEAAREIEAAALDATGLPMALARTMAPEQLLALLDRGGGMRHARALLLAELLLEDASLSAAAGRRMEEVRSRLQAFCLIGETLPVLAADEAATYRAKLQQLAGELRAASDAPYLVAKLVKYGG